MNPQEFALTYPQLMNQAIRQKLTEGELFRLRRAYDLTEELVDGFYRAQSVPFICHLVRTASIVLAEGQPIHVVIAALLHAAYTFGQFEDGICGKAATAHRQKLERVIGSEAESLVYAYDPFLLHGPEILETHLKQCETYDAVKRSLLIMRLANELEDHLDLGMAYHSDSSFHKRVEAYSDQLIVLAEKLGLSVIAQGLQESFQRQLQASGSLPGEVVRNHKNSYEQSERVWQKKSTVQKTIALTKKYLSLPRNGHSRLKLDFDSKVTFYELHYLKQDKKLIRKAKACVETHQAVEREMLEGRFKSDPGALQKVSPQALTELLESGKNINGILTNRDISNCVVINGSAFPESYSSEKIEQLRKEVDEVMSDRIKKTFYESQSLRISNSGHFLYPSGGFMGWHTNREAPGWRLYINYCEEPGKSFFRYRNPETGQIHTLWDDVWNFRLFKIDPNQLFWHTVYSETKRYSFGYRITANRNVPIYEKALFRARNLLSLGLRGNN